MEEKEKAESAVNEIITLREYLFESIGNLSVEQLNSKPAKEAWSVGQVIWHLYVVEKNVVKLIFKRLEEKEKLEQINMSNSLRTYFLNMALRSPIRFKAPEIIADAPSQIEYPLLKEKFKNIDQQWFEVIQAIPEDEIYKSIFIHPRAGKMNFFQTLQFLKEHLKRHIKQVKRTCEQLRLE